MAWWAVAPFCLRSQEKSYEKLGHTVRIIAPQYVKPFIKHLKNDQNDAEAIFTVTRQPNMKFVPTKNEEQRECPIICVTAVWFMLLERSKYDDDFQGTAGRTSEGLRAA